jgi:hypothetical protein
MNHRFRQFPMALVMAAGLAGAACTANDGAGSAAVQRMLDREAIDATMHRYLTGLDHLDRDLYADTFAPDGVLDIDGRVTTGRDAMRTVIDNEIAYRQDMQKKGRPARILFHMETNIRVTFPQADRAERTAYWVTYQRIGKDPEGLIALGVGTSVDELRRIGDEWLIARRQISLQP